MTTSADLVINRGASFIQTLTIMDVDGRPANLNGFTGKIQVRKRPDQPVITELSTEAGSIQFGGTLGLVLLFLTADQTENLKEGWFKYDFALTGRNIATRVMEGSIHIKPNITK